MNELPASFRAIAESLNITDPDGEWKKLCELKGVNPDEKHWLGWLRTAAKRTSEESKPRRNPPRLDLESGINRESGKSWREGFSRIDAPQLSFDVQVEHTTPLKALSEILEMIGTRPVTIEQIAAMLTQTPNETRTMLGSIPARITQARGAREPYKSPNRDPRCCCYERECHGFTGLCLWCSRGVSTPAADPPRPRASTPIDESKEPNPFDGLELLE
jgi:hypothetical protein